MQRRLPSNIVPFAPAVLEAITSGVVVADAQQADLPIVYVNAAFEELTGFSRDEVLGKNCRFLQGPDTDAENVSRIASALARHAPLAAAVDRPTGTALG